MTKEYTLNGKTYKINKIDFNTICELDDYGISIADAQEHGASFLRAMIAITANISLKKAGEEISREIENNGIENFQKISEVIIEAFEESDFLKKLAK